jgi:hypothetical protein
MPSLKVEDLEAERKKLAALQVRLPERVRKLRDKIWEAGEECAHQRTLVRWYSWVTEVIEALGPDWRLIGDSTDIVTDDETEGPEIFGEVELNLGGDTEGVGGFSLELSQEPGNVCLRWTDPVVKNLDMDFIAFFETAQHAATVINETIAEVRASAKE